jgi:2-octaprenyl-6-methoxyphenol hydroxylase
MTDTTLRTRVAIVGGGIAGLTLATALGQSGVETLLIDRDSTEARLAPDADGRTTAISHGTARILAASGVWERIVPHAAPITDIRITDGRSPVFLHFDHREMADETGGAPFGSVVENRLIRLFQVERLEELPSVATLAPARVTGLEVAPGGATLTLADGRTIGAELVVGADGRRSFVREAVGIEARTVDYGQTAIVGVVAHEAPHQGVGLEHFRAQGPFALVPMPDAADGTHRSSLIWCETTEEAARIAKLPQEAIDRRLAGEIGDWLGAVRFAGKRFLYPLSLVLAARETAPRIVLIGDAVHGIHPIAGQGLNLSMRDIAALSTLLVGRAGLGLDLGDAAALARYAARRRPDNMAMVAMTHGLNQLFRLRLPPVPLARSIGLAAVGRLPPLKRFFMRQAMGLGRGAA